MLVARPCEEAVPLLAGEGLSGYALPAGPGHTVVHPDPDTSSVDLAGELSKALGAPTVGTYVFDSDVVVMLVFEDGALRLDYDSCPGCFDKPETDENGNPLTPWTTPSSRPRRASTRTPSCPWPRAPWTARHWSPRCAACRWTPTTGTTGGMPSPKRSTTT
ncbi:hypothetical protein L1856_22970 [Streptomyces sp. Tue 6430]|nr:hypothetical protein [Streptomyces sp. Tue 6430]